jgi:hypothetical protein
VVPVIQKKTFGVVKVEVNTNNNDNKSGSQSSSVKHGSTVNPTPSGSEMSNFIAKMTSSSTEKGVGESKVLHRSLSAPQPSKSVNALPTASFGIGGAKTNPVSAKNSSSSNASSSSSVSSSTNRNGTSSNGTSSSGTSSSGTSSSVLAQNRSTNKTEKSGNSDGKSKSGYSDISNIGFGSQSSSFGGQSSGFGSQSSGFGSKGINGKNIYVYTYVHMHVYIHKYSCYINSKKSMDDNLTQNREKPEKNANGCKC